MTRERNELAEGQDCRWGSHPAVVNSSQGERVQRLLSRGLSAENGGLQAVEQDVQ